MNYEQLMNSHLVNHPSNPKWLHELFRPLWVALFLIVAFIGTSIFLEVDKGLGIFASLIFGGYVLVKLSFFQMISGHGVGRVKKGAFSFLGLPMMVSVIMLLLLLMSVVMIASTFTVEFREAFFPETILNLRVVSWYFFISIIASLLCWRFHIYYETWYGDEYEARREFEEKGIDNEEIERRISLMRKKGILPWKYNKHKN